MFCRKIELEGSLPSPRAAHSANIIGNKLYIFGGWNGFSAFNDVFAMDLETCTWSEILSSGTLPIPRNNHRTATYGNKIYVHGGHDGNKWLDDLFIFDTAESNWIKVNISGYKPSARACHSLNRIKKKLYMFGGFNGICSFNEMEVFDIETVSWFQLKELKGTPPIARDAHAMVTSKNYLYLFGGHDGIRHLNDLHRFDTVNHSWTEIKYEDKLPNGLRGHSANCLSNSLYIFGGYDGKMRSNELICFNLENKSWYLPVENASSKSLNFMNGRQRHSTNTYGTNKIIIFGGFDGKSMLNDVYIIDISLLEENVIKHKVSKSYVRNFKNKLFNQKHFSDITIKIKDKEIYAHKAILAAQCEKFWAMFTSLMSEDESKVLEITEYSYEIVLKLLEYFYCGQIDIDGYDHEYLMELLQISDEYMVDELHKICEKKLLSKIGNENVIHILITADSLCLKELKQECIDYMVQKFNEITQTKAYEKLALHPHLLIEVTREMASHFNLNQ